MNRRVLSGLLVLGSTLATVGAAVTADRGSNDLVMGTINSAAVDPVEMSDDADRARVQVPVRDGRLTDDVVDEQQPQPVMVRIGDIGLEAPILSVGVDERKQLDVPAADTVGWYEHSSLPGQAGQPFSPPMSTTEASRGRSTTWPTFVLTTPSRSR